MNRANLIQCYVGETRSDATVRFVEQDIFELWRYRVEHVHHLQIFDPHSCLWVPQPESNRLPHAGPGFVNLRTAVVKTFFDQTDPVSGACCSQVRYFEAGQFIRLKHLVGAQVFSNSLHLTPALNRSVPHVTQQHGIAFGTAA
ncbi:MAG: hypothetical protein AAF541_20935 [Pseudomonadota bacterium]